MLLPLPSYGILVGIVIELSADADDGKVANNIEGIVAYTTRAAADTEIIIRWNFFAIFVHLLVFVVIILHQATTVSPRTWSDR
jgi:hypothetical protein